MQKDLENSTRLFSARNLFLVLALGLIILLIVKTFPEAVLGNFNQNECIDETTECFTERNGPQKYAFWIGIYLCSLLGLILMALKPDRQNSGPFVYITLASAAALNTMLWMVVVYLGAFLFKIL